MFENHQLQYWLNDINPAFALNESGRCTIKADDSMFIVIMTDEQDSCYSLAATIIDLKGEDPLAIYKAALKANMYQSETLGGAIALNEDTDSLMLFFSESVHKVDHQGFKNTLDNFVDGAQRLKDVFTDKLEHSRSTGVSTNQNASGMMKI